MEDPIRLYVPVSITYPALEAALRKQIVGEFIPKPEEGTNKSPYAQILDLGISGSSSGVSEVIIRIKIRVLRTVLKRDQVDLYALATVAYDNERQQLYVQQFKLNSRTTSGFYNTALEVLVNKVAYSQILQESRVDLRELIGEELEKVNLLLGQGLELKGVKLKGAVNKVSVQDVVPRPNKVTCSIEVQANLEVDVLDLMQLIPAGDVG